MKLTEIYIPSNGEMIQTEIVCSGDIFIIPNNTLRLNDIIGNEKILHAMYGMTSLYQCYEQELNR